MNYNLFFTLHKISYTISFLSAKRVKQKLEEVFQNTSVGKKSETNEYQLFKNLTLQDIKAWKNEKIIINLEKLMIEQGKKYLILGENGSGKSTLLNIIVGIEKNYIGDLIINGNLYTQHDHSLNCAYATQTPFLFNDTLLNNITLYREYDVDKLNEILSILDIKELFDRKKDVIYSENDEKISGGEKQKLSMARVLLLEKEFLLLDEATSAMDKQSTLALEKYLLLNPKLTLIYVAHKTHEETIDRFDYVVEMNLC